METKVRLLISIKKLETLHRSAFAKPTRATKHRAERLQRQQQQHHHCKNNTEIFQKTTKYVFSNFLTLTTNFVELLVSFVNGLLNVGLCFLILSSRFSYPVEDGDDFFRGQFSFNDFCLL
ncbi:UNVERIFIED_CONTAM: hypothetical protein Slati_2903300 [Sesamum latifolium]|uniref:Uncharacterized protein n=1 Tax=Sesamum latifolium TaxID=2727402 RepID=A0AAW2VCC2_9LAMI